MDRIKRAAAVMAVAIAAVSVGTATAQQTGSFTDSRDGQKYKTVVIGGKTWMAENMNVKTGTSWCYDDDESNCKKYGRMYNWPTAMKMVCPSDWRLPSNQEWNSLAKAAGGGKVAGKKLKSKIGWNNRDDGSSGDGTDNYGFSALPGGGRGPDETYNHAGGGGYWWTATEDGVGSAYDRGMGYNYDAVSEGSNDKVMGFSVRCVKE